MNGTDRCGAKNGCPAATAAAAEDEAGHHHRLVGRLSASTNRFRPTSTMPDDAHRSDRCASRKTRRRQKEEPFPSKQQRQLLGAASARKRERRAKARQPREDDFAAEEKREAPLRNNPAKSPGNDALPLRQQLSQRTDRTAPMEHFHDEGSSSHESSTRVLLNPRLGTSSSSTAALAAPSAPALSALRGRQKEPPLLLVSSRAPTASECDHGGSAASGGASEDGASYRGSHDLIKSTAGTTGNSGYGSDDDGRASGENTDEASGRPDEKNAKKKIPRSSLCCCAPPSEDGRRFRRRLLLSISSFRDFCGNVVNHPKLQLAIVLLIAVNAVMMGIGTFDFVTENPNVSRAFELTDRAFLSVFTVEIGMQFIYHGVGMFADGWLLFDFLIVVMSWSMESLQIVRSFRIFRAFRLVTRLSVLRNLIMALFAVAPSMSAIIALLVLIIYIYSVLCTTLFSDLYALGVTEEDYFGTLDVTFFTLFQMITLEWADIARQVMDEYFWAWAIFSSFLVLTSFILYSLIIAVVCDAVQVQEHQDKVSNEVREKEETKQRVFALEQRVGDIAQRQFVILESLQIALRELEKSNVRYHHGQQRSKDGPVADDLMFLSGCFDEFSDDSEELPCDETAEDESVPIYDPMHQYQEGTTNIASLQNLPGYGRGSGDAGLDGTTSHAVVASPFGDSLHHHRHHSAHTSLPQESDQNQRIHARVPLPRDICGATSAGSSLSISGHAVVVSPEDDTDNGGGGGGGDEHRS